MACPESRRLNYQPTFFKTDLVRESPAQPSRDGEYALAWYGSTKTRLACSTALNALARYQRQFKKTKAAYRRAVFLLPVYSVAARLRFPPAFCFAHRAF
jgi:hypothetical protein